MITLRTYSQPEQAHITAGLLCNAGIDAVLTRDPSWGGALFGVAEVPYRLEVPENQVEEACVILNQLPFDSPNPLTSNSFSSSGSKRESSPNDEGPHRNQSASHSEGGARIHKVFRSILIFDTICIIAYSLPSKWWQPDEPQAVSDYLESLVISNGLWELVYLCGWPHLFFMILGNVLCYFYNSLGRTLFLVTTVWGTLSYLGPPPLVVGLFNDFLGTIQTTLTGVALALMYWSPLAERFGHQRHEDR